MNEEYWRTLHDIASGRPLYIRVDTIQALQKLGLVTFSWRHRGLVLTRAGKEAIAAEVLSTAPSFTTLSS